MQAGKANGMAEAPRCALLLVIFAACGAPALARETPQQAFAQWLTAYNGNDTAALTAFYERQLGDSSRSLWALDNRDETGGLDVMAVEVDTPERLQVRLRERNDGGLQRVSLTLSPGEAEGLSAFEQQPLPMPTADALNAMDAFAARLSQQDRFSGVILVEQRDQRLYQRAFGLADRGTGRKLALDTPFFIASASKMFTSVAILQLVEQGRIRLDDTVGAYLTDYPNRELAEKVTIRHLLTHRGGTGDIGILLPEESAQRKTVRTLDDALALNGRRAPEFEPGSREAYSNYGFILLGAIIEKVAGQDYYAYVQEHVLSPAGMTATRFPTLEELDGVARGYYRNERAELTDMAPMLPWRPMSAGGAVSTADDLSRFVAALNDGRLLTPAMLAQATRQQTPWYGYGFIVSPPAEFPHWGHGGGAPGQNVVVAYYPSIATTMICLSNRDPMPCDRLMISLHYHLYAPGTKP